MNNAEDLAEPGRSIVSSDLQAQIDALHVMTTVLFALAAKDQRDPVAWVEDLRQPMIEMVKSGDKLRLQKARQEIDLRMSDVLHWMQAQQEMLHKIAAQRKVQ